MSAEHRWLIIVRVSRDSNPHSGTAEMGMSWRLSDRRGVLPNQDEQLKITSTASQIFFDKWHVTASRVVLTQVPYFPSDGELVPWTDFELAKVEG